MIPPTASSLHIQYLMTSLLRVPAAPQSGDATRVMFMLQSDTAAGNTFPAV